jgi:hypothetical protein
MDLSLYPSNVDLTKIPALDPPPGVTPDFVDPATRANLTLVSCAGIVAVMILFVMLRMYTKIYVIQTTGWDDCKQIRPLSTRNIYVATNMTDIDICILASVR